MILGPMFAGKSIELLRRLVCHQIAGKRCLSIKYTDEEVKQVRSKAMKFGEASYNELSVSNLKQIRNYWKKFDLITVGQGHLFPDTSTFAQIAASNGKLVIISALNGNHNMEPWGQVTALVPHSDQITNLTAVCSETGKEANFTQRVEGDDG